MANNFCSNCGEPTGSGANVCTNCGKPLNPPQTESVTNESYKNSMVGDDNLSGSSDAQLSGSSNAQTADSGSTEYAGGSNTQADSGNTEYAGGSNAQADNTNNQYTGGSSAQNAGSNQQTGNENTTRTYPNNVVTLKEINPIIPILLSFFFPGAGQVYNGKLQKGLLILITTVFMTLFFWPIAILIWLYNLYDAYNDSNKMKKGELPITEATSKDAIIYIATVIGIFFALLILIVFFFALFGLMLI